MGTSQTKLERFEDLETGDETRKRVVLIMRALENEIREHGAKNPGADFITILDEKIWKTHGQGQDADRLTHLVKDRIEDRFDDYGLNEDIYDLEEYSIASTGVRGSIIIYIKMKRVT